MLLLRINIVLIMPVIIVKEQQQLFPLFFKKSKKKNKIVAGIAGIFICFYCSHFLAKQNATSDKLSKDQQKRKEKMN